MGELFNSPHEWVPLIKDRLIDFLRIHLTQAGGEEDLCDVDAYDAD